MFEPKGITQKMRIGFLGTEKLGESMREMKYPGEEVTRGVSKEFRW
jgi:hypothetical protein